MTIATDGGTIAHIITDVALTADKKALHVTWR